MNDVTDKDHTRDHQVPTCCGRARASDTPNSTPRSNRSEGSSEPPPCDEVVAGGGAAAVVMTTKVLAVAAGDRHRPRGRERARPTVAGTPGGRFRKAVHDTRAPRILGSTGLY